MNIKILGPSCANCLKLEMLVMETLVELGIRDASVEKVFIGQEMERYLTGAPPGLVIDDQLVWSGGESLPSKAHLAGWIREALETSTPIGRLDRAERKKENYRRERR